MNQIKSGQKLINEEYRLIIYLCKLARLDG